MKRSWNEVTVQAERCGKHVIVVRHGEAQHNIKNKSWQHFDPTLGPLLTELGVQQAVKAREALASRISQPLLLACSTLLRTVQTAQLLVPTASEIVVQPLLRERCADTCDEPVALPVMRQWADRCCGSTVLRLDLYEQALSEAGGHTAYLKANLASDFVGQKDNREGLKARAQQLTNWVQTQTASTIVLVGHAAFLQRLTGDSWMENGELRHYSVFDGAWSKVPEVVPLCSADQNPWPLNFEDTSQLASPTCGSISGDMAPLTTGLPEAVLAPSWRGYPADLQRITGDSWMENAEFGHYSESNGSWSKAPEVASLCSVDENSWWLRWEDTDTSQIAPPQCPSLSGAMTPLMTGFPGGALASSWSGCPADLQCPSGNSWTDSGELCSHSVPEGVTSKARPVARACSVAQEGTPQVAPPRCPSVPATVLPKGSFPHAMCAPSWSAVSASFERVTGDSWMHNRELGHCSVSEGATSKAPAVAQMSWMSQLAPPRYPCLSGGTAPVTLGFPDPISGQSWSSPFGSFCGQEQAWSSQNMVDFTVLDRS